MVSELLDDDEPFILDPVKELQEDPELYPGHLNTFIPSPQKKLPTKRARKSVHGSKSAISPKRRKINAASDKCWDIGTSSNASGSAGLQARVHCTLAHADNTMEDARNVLHEANMEMQQSANMDWEEAPLDSGTGIPDFETGFGESEPESAHNPYDEFVQLIDDDYLVFVQVTTYLYVVEGFDMKKQHGTRSYYHLEARKRGDDVSLSCSCPMQGDCLHVRYYCDFRQSRFLPNENGAVINGSAVLFWQEMIGEAQDEEIWVHRFSVEGDGSEAVRSRAIVSYKGPNSGRGKWECTKDANARCAHITKAKYLLEKFAEGWEDEDGDNALDDMYIVDGSNAKRMEERAISHLPIMPPKWAELPTDKVLYTRADPCQELPELLALDSNSRSLCGKFFDKQRPVIVKECVVYTLTEEKRRRIETQNCTDCPRSRKCTIGPDPRHLGLFNYNNSALFSHELLDEYTNRYTSSETPMVAFVQAVGRVYEGRQHSFVGEDLFRSAWFAFISIQQLERDMSCPECGLYPETAIWDGVTLAFGKRHLQDSLRPPTHIPENAVSRRRRRVKKQQWIQDVGDNGRARIRLHNWIKKWGGKKVVQTRKLDQGSESTEGSAGEDEDEDAGQNELFGEVERRNVELLEIKTALEAADAAPVAKLLYDVYGPAAAQQDWRMRKRYRMLFEQLSADESAMQMVNGRGLKFLRLFVEEPTANQATLLVDIPALMLIVEHDLRTGQDISSLLELCRWMVKRAGDVLSKLKDGDFPELGSITDAAGASDDWKKTGCCYGLPPLRTRPAYPNLAEDGKPEKDVKR